MTEQRDAGHWWTQLDGLTHVERMRELVELGQRASQGDTEAAARIAEAWASDEGYPRSLALATLFGSRDGELVLAALSDPSRTVRRRAVKLVPVLCDDDRCAKALLLVRGHSPRKRLVERLLRRKRQAPLDRFLREALTASNIEPQHLDLLGYGSPQLVEALLARHADRLSPAGWCRLAKAHPELTAQTLLARHQAPGAVDARSRWLLSQLLLPLAESSAEATLPLVEALLTTGSERKYWLSGPLRELVRQAPRATFDVLRRLQESTRPVPPPGPFGAVRFDKVVHQLDDDRLAYLIRHAYATLSDGRRARRWFLRLTAPQRELVVRTWLAHGRGSWGAFLLRHVPADNPGREPAFRRWSAAAQNQEGVIAPKLLVWLPADLRAREARRHLTDVEALTTQPVVRMAYAGLLPWDQARDALASWLSHPEGEMRAVALRALLSVPEHTQDVLPSALEEALSRRFEQDPVRLAMLSTLAALPLGRFATEHLDALAQVFQHALDAADLSHSTSAAIEALTVRLFRLDAPWAAGWLCRLLDVRGIPSSIGLVEGLLPDEIRTLAPAVEELCDRWTDRERAGALLWLARSFGRRLRLVPALQRALERLALELPFVAVAATALDMLRRHAPERFAAIAVTLVEEDKSSIAVPAIAFHLSTRRQDLLTPFLAGKKMKGRFASGRSHWIIHFGVGFGTWTAQQQQTHSATLCRLLGQRKRSVPTLRRALFDLARLAFAPQDALVPFASDPRPPVREMAVRALPYLDDGSGIPVLIECLGDDRARWAIYALRQSFSEMSQDEVVDHLRGVSLAKVTVAKEVMRLLGELGGQAGYAELVAIDRASLHRDVKIALLRALWDHLDQRQTWAIFEEGLADPDWVVASRLAHIPLGRLDPVADERLSALLTRLVARPELEARLDLLRRAAALPLRDSHRTLFEACLGRLAAPYRDEAQTALQAVLFRMKDRDVDGLTKQFQQLMGEPRRIDALLEALPRHLGPYAAKPVLALGAAVLRTIRDEVNLAAHSIHLAGVLLEAPGLVEHLRRVSKRHLLHYDCMVAAVSAIGRAVHPDTIEQQLRTQDDPRLRRLALEALTVASRPKRGWTKARRARLLDYQQDPDPLVASAAAFVFPPTSPKAAAAAPTQR